MLSYLSNYPNKSNMFRKSACKKSPQNSRTKQNKYFDLARFDYLKQMKQEFETTKVQVSKQQILANLANFSYNPENYAHLYTLSVPQMFLANLDSSDCFIRLTSLKGLCNLATYPPIAVLLCEIETLRQVVKYIEFNCDYTDFVIQGTLLLVTLKRSKLIIENQLNSMIVQMTEALPEITRKDIRVHNLCHILLHFNESQWSTYQTIII